MPVSRVTTEGLADRVAELYGNAEVRLLRIIAARLAKGLDSPKWAEEKLAELQGVRSETRRVLAQVHKQASTATADALQTAYLRGTATAEGELVTLGIDAGSPDIAKDAVVRLASAAEEQLQKVSLRVLRAVPDAYREAVLHASAGTLTGTATRVQDAQVALNRLASKGITAFTDKAGRNWGLKSYVDMATRTTTAQAAVLGHLDRLDRAGIPLVQVSDSPNECPLCAPWEGTILSRGPVGALQRNVVTGDMEAVQIDGTVDEAISAGLFHPNCTHNLSAYVPGFTVAHEATSNPDPNRSAVRTSARQTAMSARKDAVAIS